MNILIPKKLQKFVYIFVFSFFMISSCQKLESFKGKWRGRIKQTELLRKGFDYCTDLVLDIRNLEASELDADFQLVRNQTEVCQNMDKTSVIELPSDKLTVSLIKEYFNDSISEMKFAGNPLFTHIAFLKIGEKPAIMHISYFKGPGITVRIISSDLYGVFELHKE